MRGIGKLHNSSNKKGANLNRNCVLDGFSRGIKFQGYDLSDETHRDLLEGKDVQRRVFQFRKFFFFVKLEFQSFWSRWSESNFFPHFQFRLYVIVLKVEENRFNLLKFHVKNGDVEKSHILHTASILN